MLHLTDPSQDVCSLSRDPRYAELVLSSPAAWQPNFVAHLPTWHASLQVRLASGDSAVPVVIQGMKSHLLVKTPSHLLQTQPHVERPARALSLHSLSAVLVPLGFGLFLP